VGWLGTLCGAFPRSRSFCTTHCGFASPDPKIFYHSTISFYHSTILPFWLLRKYKSLWVGAGAGEDAHTTAGLETRRYPATAIFVPGCEPKDHERLFSFYPYGITTCGGATGRRRHAAARIVTGNRHGVNLAGEFEGMLVILQAPHALVAVCSGIPTPR
jgi:hypothetical protein